LPSKSAGAPVYPAVTLTDIEGKTIRPEDLKGRVVLVELWATWCPPCRSTLGWLGSLKQRFGDRLAVVAISVESPEDKIRKLVTDLNLPLTWVIGKPDVIRAFGDVSAVPTLLVFDENGKAAGAFFGAPPTLHTDAETKLAALLR